MSRRNLVSTQICLGRHFPLFLSRLNKTKAKTTDKHESNEDL